MNKVSVSLAAILGLGISTPALAQSNTDRAGSIQIKALATAVLPNGEITDVEIDELGLPAGSQSEANDNITPTIAIEYFLNNNISVETIAGVTQHDVDGTGALEGAELVSDLMIIPATITAKAHFDLGDSGIKPYVGAGATYFMIFDEEPGAGVGAFDINDVDLTNEFGFVLQAGLDFALDDSGLGLSVDAKRYFVGTDARFFDDGEEVLRTAHDLDPWVVSAGISYRF